MPRRFKISGEADFEFLAIVSERFKGRGFIKYAQAFFGCGKTYGMGGVGAAMGRAAIFERSHHIFTARHRCNRITIGHCLGEGADVRFHTMERLHAALGDAEAGFYFIDNEQDVIYRRGRALLSQTRWWRKLRSNCPSWVQATWRPICSLCFLKISSSRFASFIGT